MFNVLVTTFTLLICLAPSTVGDVTNHTNLHYTPNNKPNAGVT